MIPDKFLNYKIRKISPNHYFWTYCFWGNKGWFNFYFPKDVVELKSLRNEGAFPLIEWDIMNLIFLHRALEKENESFI